MPRREAEQQHGLSSRVYVPILREIVKRKSIFLFGPRQTGKSTLVRHTFPAAAFYDLLEADTFREISARPEYLRQTLSPQQLVVVVDEVQKLPALLDEIQLLLDRNKKLRESAPDPVRKDSGRNDYEGH